jgi:ABC-type spermidine/putrescine transport system permease subunit II
MDVALSRNGRIALRALFVLVVLFLYLPIAILLIFSFNNSEVPTFPLSGFTLHWYHQFLTNGDLRGALQTSAIIAAISSAGAVVLGVLASVALTRRRVRGRAVVSAFLIAFTTSFDEYAVASFVVGTRTTFPIYLYSALRFPNQLPQVIAVAVVVITVSLFVVVAAEVGRRIAERRLGALES